MQRHPSPNITLDAGKLSSCRINVMICERIVSNCIVSVVKKLQEIAFYSHLVSHRFKFNLVVGFGGVHRIVVVIIIRVIRRAIKKLVALPVPVERVIQLQRSAYLILME